MLKSLIDECLEKPDLWGYPLHDVCSHCRIKQSMSRSKSMKSLSIYPSLFNVCYRTVLAPTCRHSYTPHDRMFASLFAPCSCIPSSKSRFQPCSRQRALKLVEGSPCRPISSTSIAYYSISPPSIFFQDSFPLCSNLDRWPCPWLDRGSVHNKVTAGVERGSKNEDLLVGRGR